MNTRPYYFVGKRLLTQHYAGYMHPYDIALYEEHPVTADRVRASLPNELEIADSIKALKKYQRPIHERDCDIYIFSEYQVPLFTIYIPDESHIQRQPSGRYTVQRKHVIIHEVSVCEKSYTNSFYPSAYHSFLKTNVTDEIVKDIKALFRDYAHPRFGLFLTLHWNRHYTTLADKIINEMPGKMQEAYAYLLAQRQKMAALDQTNLAGSFMRRMDFALSKLITEMNKQNAVGQGLKL